MRIHLCPLLDEPGNPVEPLEHPYCFERSSVVDPDSVHSCKPLFQQVRIHLDLSRNPFHSPHKGEIL